MKALSSPLFSGEDEEVPLSRQLDLGGGWELESGGRRKRIYGYRGKEGKASEETLMASAATFCNKKGLLVEDGSRRGISEMHLFSAFGVLSLAQILFPGRGEIASKTAAGGNKKKP